GDLHSPHGHVGEWLSQYKRSPTARPGQAQKARADRGNSLATTCLLCHPRSENARLINGFERLRRLGFDQLFYRVFKAFDRGMELWHGEGGEQFFAICKRIMVDVYRCLTLTTVQTDPIPNEPGSEPRRLHGDVDAHSNHAGMSQRRDYSIEPTKGVCVAKTGVKVICHRIAPRDTGPQADAVVRDDTCIPVGMVKSVFPLSD